MAKGSRARSNIQPAKKAVESIPKPLTTRTELFKNYPIRTLNTNDVNRFKEMVTLSNNVAGLLKQCIDTDTSVQKGNEVAQAMLDGKIKGAAMQKVTANLFLPLNDMKDVAKKITGEVETLKQANIISKGQLSQRYDEYIDSMKNLRSLLDQLLKRAPSDDLSKIRGDRAIKSSKSAEQVIFEKAADKMTQKDRDFVKGIKKKIDENAAKKIKESTCECKSCKSVKKAK